METNKKTAPQRAALKLSLAYRELEKELQGVDSGSARLSVYVKGGEPYRFSVSRSRPFVKGRQNKTT